MGKLTISRLALAVTISGLLIYPVTPSFAAPKWLQEMFTVDPPRSQKAKKPRRAKAKQTQSSSRASSNIIRTPATAPMPEPAPRGRSETENAAAAPVPEDKPQQEQVEEKPAPDMQAPSETATEDTAKDTAEPLDTAPAEPPKPEPRPEPKPETPEVAPEPPAEPEQAAEPNPPAESPIPEFRPDKPDPAELGPDHEKTKADEAKPDEPPPPPDPRSARRADPSGELPDEEAACRWRLTKLGVKFKEGDERTDPTGCSIPYPIVIENLGTDIDLKPQAEMNCAMAEAAVRFAKGPMSTAANDVFGVGVKSIAHASAYVCRPRNGSQKLSEHAFGNALDISSFTLSNGTVITVEPTPPEKNAELLDRVRKEACGPFKTVLGPGVPDHSEHLHFDLAPRRNGSAICE